MAAGRIAAILRRTQVRIAVHDYGGYAFIVSLSRALARRGHQVLHLFASRNPTPRGRMQRLPNDPETIQIRGIAIRDSLQKYRYLKRWSQEREYGKRLAAEVRDWDPEIVLSANTPIDSQAALFSTCQTQGIPFVFWVQDLIGDAMQRILTQRFGAPGKWLGEIYIRRELHMIQEAARVVVISQAFADRLSGMGISRARVHVETNWAPVDELPLLEKDNTWSRENGFNTSFNFLYSGSLGLKHDPSILLSLARAIQSDDLASLVVVSEGLGASWLAGESDRLGLRRMHLMPFQPMETFPEVLAAADVLLALLEPDAGEYSVPSKVLSYLCAGRPMVLAVPETNLAAQWVLSAGAGEVVSPGDGKAFVRAALALRDDPDKREAMGQAGRAFAEARFDPDAVAGRFESVLRAAVSKRVAPDA